MTSAMDLDVVLADTGEGTVVARLLLDGRLIWATPPAPADEDALDLLKDTCAQALRGLLEQAHAHR